MFDSRSPVIKIGGYIIIGFFSIIIIISFGMPDFMSKLGMDQNVVAIVNGEKINRIDYVRYKDRAKQQMGISDESKMQEYILNSLITRKLMLQKAEEIGIEVTDDKIGRMIKRISVFQNSEGKFDKETMDRYLNYNHLNLSDFVIMVREDLILQNMQNLISLGVNDLSPDEINMDYMIENSGFKIQYCFISSADITKRYKDRINVTEEEIDSELQKSKEEIKDPATDRKRIKEKLEKAKINKYKNELISDINKLAEEKMSFAKAASILGGKISVSKEFKIGDPIESMEKGKNLYPISNSAVFNSSLLHLTKGQTSQVIDSFDGLYIFTLMEKKISTKKPTEEERSAIINNNLYDINNSIYMTMLSGLREKSKIIKNIKFN